MDGASNPLNDSERAQLSELLGALREKGYLSDPEEVQRDIVPENPASDYLNTPKIVYYAVSEFCNLTCPFCYADSKNRSAPYRGDTARSLRVVDRLAAANLS